MDSGCHDRRVSAPSADTQKKAGLSTMPLQYAHILSPLRFGFKNERMGRSVQVSFVILEHDASVD